MICVSSILLVLLQLQRGKQYSSIEELFKDFLGKAVRVTVKTKLQNTTEKLMKI